MPPLGEWPIERTWGHTQQFPGFMDPARTQQAQPKLVYAPPGPTNPADVAALQQAKALERELVWWSQLAPHQAPPFRATPLMVYARAVLNTSTGSAIGTAGATAIATAQSLVSTVSVLPSTAVAFSLQTPVVIASYKVPPNMRAVVRLWAAQLGDGATEAVSFSLRGGNGGQVESVNLAAFSALERPADTIMLVTEGRTIELLGKNNDTVAPAYVEVVFKGWIYPVLQSDDNLRASISDSFGPNPTNGRFSRVPCSPGGGP